MAPTHRRVHSTHLACAPGSPWSRPDPLWFEAKETGKGEISCAQLCGLGHYRMKGFFSVDTDEEYAAWLAEQAESSGGADDYY